MNWLSKQINKLAKNLGENFGEAPKKFQESYKDSLKNSDWAKLESKEGTEPFFDLFKKGKKIKVIAETPGVKKEELEVGLFDKNTLHIYAPTDSRNYSADIELPGRIKNNSTSYYYKNGVLSINLELM